MVEEGSKGQVKNLGSLMHGVTCRFLRVKVESQQMDSQLKLHCEAFCKKQPGLLEGK